MVLDCDLIRREFVKKNYGDIKTRNPTLPVLIRECSGVEPQLWARYGKQPPIPSLPATRDLALSHGSPEGLFRFIDRRNPCIFQV